LPPPARDDYRQLADTDASASYAWDYADLARVMVDMQREADGWHLTGVNGCRR
jgi:hypothetical protein